VSTAPALPRGPHSVFAKLVAILLIMAVALLAAVSLFFWQIVTPMLNGAVTQVHGELARATAARAPDLAEARAFTARTGIEVLYEGPRGAWSTSGRAHDMRGLEEYHPKLFIATRDVSIVPAADGGRYAFIARFGPNMRSAHTWLFVTLLVIMALVVLVTHAVLRRLLDPLRALGEGVARLGEGRFDRLGLPPRRDEFGALSAAFDRMVDRLAAMMRARDQLLVDVSHELRSPITRLKVALELLPADDQRRRMQGDVAEMEAMVGELLELERLRDGRGVQPAVIDLGALVADVACGFDGVSPGVHVEAQAAIVAAVDESRIRMVLRNLIENAIKYSLPDSAPVRVHLQRTADTVSIDVRDDGIGIPEADLPQLFVPFFRVDRSRSKKTGGYGLGLSICQRIAEAHGGAITVERVQPRGSRFTVTLPVDRAQPSTV
jgi:signal transduction histidine kinase